MATTTVEPQTPTTAPVASTGLLPASFLGAAVVLLGIALAGYGVPLVWDMTLGTAFANSTGFTGAFLKLVVQVLGAGVIIAIGTRLGGGSPPRGLRGGIFLAVSCVIASFFIARSIGFMAGGLPSFVVACVVLLIASWFLLNKPGATKAMRAIEEQGWLHTNNFKATQGLRLRRYTMIGLMIIGLSGCWTLFTQKLLGSGPWQLAMPGIDTAITLVSDKEYAIPVLLGLVSAWFAWRAINVPDFADFLIATEAEMNKVSWSTRKRLIQDTIVVLTTTILLTVFLLGVDVFWGWLLSRQAVGVLPSRDVVQQKADPQGAKSEW
ncbi:MAG: preprotein translocase subunit SecE [Gemmataceae bacterium]